MDEGLPSASFLLLAAVLIADIFVFGFDAAITRVNTSRRQTVWA